MAKKGVKHNKYEIDDKLVFDKLIKDAFKFKRKNLRNNLKSYNLDLISSVLSKYNKDLTVRAENLSVQEFVEISNVLFK